MRTLTAVRTLALGLVMGTAPVFCQQTPTITKPAPSSPHHAPGPFSSPPTEAAGTNYALAPGDIVTIKVFREPDLDVQQRVSKEGTINYPLLGVLKVSGMSSDQTAGKIAGLLDKDYLVKPQVSVSVISYSKQKFMVLGQVTSPGSYNIPDEQTLDLLNAIAIAGGFTRLAKTSKVVVTRFANGEAKTVQIDVDKMMKTGSTDRFSIQPNDVIIVEEKIF